jgi:hypothetical protein
MKEKKNHIYICSILLTKVRLTLKKKKKKIPWINIILIFTKVKINLLTAYFIKNPKNYHLNI